MQVFHPPDDPKQAAPSLFLAGGISLCDDWQTEMLEYLKFTNIWIFNPRRKEYIHKDEVAREQIRWEHKWLHAAHAISFWFPHESVCPITLFELGHWAEKGNIAVGVHPLYSRKLDIEEQMKLINPSVKIENSLQALGDRIIKWSMGDPRNRV